MGKVKVVASPLPFSNFQMKLEVDAGCNLLEIVKQVIPEKYVDDVEAVVMVGGDIIPRDDWEHVTTIEGELVNVRVIPAGGGGGKKNPITTILSIAVLVAAPYIGTQVGFALAGGMGPLTSGQLLVGRLVAGIVGVVGTMLVNALAPPPKPTRSVSDPAESPTLFIEGARNAFNSYGPVPVCLGTNRMFPLQAAKAYTETENNAQYVRQLFTYGYGNNMSLTDFRIGDTPLTSFSNFDVEHFTNGNLHDGGRLWARSVIQNNESVLLKSVDGWTQRTVPTNSNEVIVDFTFSRGLVKFDSAGKRTNHSVQVEVQYRPVGSSDWIGGTGFQNFSGTEFTVTGTTPVVNRPDIIVINVNTGQISYITGSPPAQGKFIDRVLDAIEKPAVPSECIKLADVSVTTTVTNGGFGQPPVYTTNITVTDTRAPSIGRYLEDSDSFVPTKTDSNKITISGGGLSSYDLTITAASSEAVPRSHRIKFPAAGDYEVRIRRVTADTDDTKIIDLAYLTAIKGVRYQKPVNATGLCGTAIRIKATDQLNGALDQFNTLASNIIPDWDSELGVWLERPTNNPASIYLYVLRGEANAKPVPDYRIDFEKLQEWHEYCDSRGYTCDIVIDYNTSVADTLALVASSGSASPTIVDAKRSVVIDRAGKDVVQVITPRNSWGYKGEMIYPDLPHAFRATFRNAEKGYVMDERIVYRDGYNASNASLFEELQLVHCTNADLAWKHARRYMATAILRPETHIVNMDIENLIATRGDRVKLVHDVPLIGLGQGRIKSIETDIDDKVVSITLDDVIPFPSTGSFYVRIRYQDGTQLYREVTATAGYQYTLTFATPLDAEDTPSIGDLCAVSEGGGELDCIITRIEPGRDLTAKITLQNYAPEIFDAETGTIPPFNSVITTPLEFIRPLPPRLLQAQSDESVMQRNVDGSFTSLGIFTLENPNEGDIILEVKYRSVGSTQFESAKLLESNPERFVITGLDDGRRYDIWVRYRRAGGLMWSNPLQINNYLFVGKSGPPADVANFRIDVSNQLAVFNWDKNEDIDISHYEVRFSSANEGVSWDTSQVLEERVFDNRLTVIAQSGTYLIKAVDLSGNYSVNAAVISTFGLENILNAVEILQESPDFLGVKDNTVLYGAGLAIDDLTEGEGYYYFYNSIDLTDVFTSYVSSSFIVGGDFKNDMFAMDDMFVVDNLFGSGDNDMFAMDDMFAVDDLFGIEAGSWDAQLQWRYTDDDPSGTPVWSDWVPFTAGSQSFRAAEFRVWLRSFDPNITPVVRELSVNIDMPDRIERGDDLTVPEEGITITYSPAFKAVPATAITLQDGDAGDELVYLSKTADGFEFRVYNRISMTYVERIFDFISSGYGRVE